MTPTSYNHKANQGEVPDDKDNVLNCDFKADTVNQKWVTDITYIQVLKECDEDGNIDTDKMDALLPWADELPECCKKKHH